MTTRRGFLTTSLAASAAVVVSSISRVRAAASGRPVFPRGIVYTRDSAGKWAGKAGSHAPVVTVTGQQVIVETRHGMSEQHYIVRHTIVSPDGEVLGEKTFHPSDEKARSVFTLQGDHPVLYATSFCNKHDLWVTEFRR